MPQSAQSGRCCLFEEEEELFYLVSILIDAITVARWPLPPRILTDPPLLIVDLRRSLPSSTRLRFALALKFLDGCCLPFVGSFEVPAQAVRNTPTLGLSFAAIIPTAAQVSHFIMNTH